MADTTFPFDPSEQPLDSGDTQEWVPQEDRRRGRRIRRSDLAFNVLFVVILAVAGWLRLDAQNWDDYSHLHPDERFLTELVSLLNGPLHFTDKSYTDKDVVDGGDGAHRRRCEQRYPKATAITNMGIVTQMEAGRGGYFDAECSPLNPNNVGKGLYVYGEFPLFTVHLAGVARSHLSSDLNSFWETFDPPEAKNSPPEQYWESYTGAQLVGRTISAVSDWLTVIVLFLLGRRLFGRWPGLLAAALYAVAAFPIQQAHFWTVDAFTTLWVMLALYFAVRVIDHANAIQGPSTLAYTAIWAGGLIWETAYWERPVLGLAALGVIFLALLVFNEVFRAVRQMLGFQQEVALGATLPLIASFAYLGTCLGLMVAAPRDFPLSGGLLKLGLTSLLFALTVLSTFVAAHVVRTQTLYRAGPSRHYAAIGLVGAMWMALMAAYLFNLLSPWATLVVAMAAAGLMIFDILELADYALFGVALGGAVASRINVAPLAGIIVLAAGIRALPALDRALSSEQRKRLVAHAMTGVMAAALMSFIVFRLLQPHAFLGPGLFGLRLNPGWREDISDAAYMNSGNWDAPPNYQWTSRPPYLFAWRNIVLWGLGIPLGLVAWAAWAWAGVILVRGRRNWTRLTIPFCWILVCFGWLGGRWVMTMRYFLPIYPALALFAAWALWAMLLGARRVRAVRIRRLAWGGAVTLLIVVLGYTTLYGFGFHSIERRQLTRVAASRWFQEFVPGDFGIWVEGSDGTRQMVNLGLSWVSSGPVVTQLQQGESSEFAFTLPAGDATLTGITLHRVFDPARDPGPESLGVWIFQDDPSLGRRLIYQTTLTEDFSQNSSPYGSQVVIWPDHQVVLEAQPDATLSSMTQYKLQIAVLDGGPVSFAHGIATPTESVLSDISVGLETISSQTVTSLEFSLEGKPLLTPYGDDIPSPPTYWTVGGADSVPFDIPIDGEIREMDISHLGDVLHDTDAETVRFTLIAPDGTQTTAVVTDDFDRGADPLGPPRTVTFDPPLKVQRLNQEGKVQRATLVVQAQDPVYTYGPVVAWEGSWDDPVPVAVCPLPPDMVYRDDLPSGLSHYTCNAMDLYAAHYESFKLWLVAEDNDQKYTAMVNGLDQADYLVITSNRFYDSLSRIPMRWPMTMAYYDALFDGRLGFELVKTFTSYPQIGPFTLPDEILPTQNLPKWLNNQWEAEEAFHVYDHPAVLVFRKTAAYSPENTRAILNSVSRRPVSSAFPGYVVDPDPVGLVPWGAKQASAAPTLLEFDQEQWNIQRSGGTWSKLFDMQSLVNRSQVAAVICWWLLMVVVGWLVWPLLFAIFPALPDRAFPAAKITAWVIVAWAAWVGGTLHVLTWTRPGILVIVIVLGLLSWLIGLRRRAELVPYIRAHWKHLLALEGLTLLLFLGFLGVRLGNPDLWHSALGGEKPMDFAYFNGVLRSTIFPPIDPWFSGGYINYYYFGYVIVGAPVKLLGVRPSVAYNLILPTLYAMTGVGVFSVAYNWVKGRNARSVRSPADGGGRVLPGWQEIEAQQVDVEPEPRAPAGNPWLAGILALVLAVVLGNLGTLYVLVSNIAAIDNRWQPQPMLSQVRQQELEAQRGDIYQDFYQQELKAFRKDHGGRDPDSDGEMASVVDKAQKETDQYINDEARHPPLTRIWSYGVENVGKQLRAFFSGLGDVMKGDPIPMSTHRWYWQPTRIISELPGGAGSNAIAEMPYFTFLYGDLHAHMIAMPVTMLALLWLLAEIMGAGRKQRTWWEAGLALGLGALVIGILRPTNSWDWLTYMILGVAGLTYTAWVGAVHTHYNDPPAPSAERVWNWIKPRWAFYWWFALASAALGMMLVRLVLHLYRLSHNNNLIAVGKAAAAPTLTISSLLAWGVLGAALIVLVYIALLVVLRAYMDKPLLLSWLGRVALFVVLTFVAQKPFTAYFATAYKSIKPWTGDRTPLWAYLYIHGLFLFLVLSFLIWQTARWLRRVTVRQLQGMAIPVVIGGLGLMGALVVSLFLGVREVPALQVAGPLIAWSVVLFLLPRQNPLLRMIYALIVLALAITIGVEVIVLDGDIGRQNTVFKFYIQVWFLLSVVGGVTLAWMLHSSRRWSLLLRGAWQSMLAILFTIALLYPVLGTQARFLDRFNKADTPLTLDGMEYMKYALHGEHNIWFRLDSDYRLIRWMQDNIQGTPVIVEAHLYPSEYHWGGRISIYTGLPTLLGWNWHQRQQRGLPQMGALVQTRENNVAAFYTLSGTAGIDAAWNLIRDYDVEYIVVGILERVFYDDIAADPMTNHLSPGHSPGLAKFDQMVDMGLLKVVYTSSDCLDPNIKTVEECPAESVYMDKIYQVVPDAAYQSQALASGDSTLSGGEQGK